MSISCVTAKNPSVQVTTLAGHYLMPHHMCVRVQARVNNIITRYNKRSWVPSCILAIFKIMCGFDNFKFLPALVSGACA